MTENNKSHYVNMPIAELVKALCDHAQPGSKMHEEIKGALSAALVVKITESIDNHERASSRLANQVLYLNIILGLFTIIGTILTIVAFIKQTP
jgi:Mg2+ and Co2+ transporter CorA